MFQKRLKRLGKLFEMEPTSIQAGKSYFPSASALFEDIVYKVFEACMHLNGASLSAKSPKLIFLSNDLRLLALNTVRNTIDSVIKCAQNQSPAIRRKSPSEQLLPHDTGNWTCIRCTYISTSMALQCEVCGGLKPAVMPSSSSKESPKSQKLKRSLDTLERNQPSSSARDIIVIEDEVAGENAEGFPNVSFFTASVEQSTLPSGETSFDSSVGWRISKEWQHELRLLGIKQYRSNSEEVIHENDLELLTTIEELNKADFPASTMAITYPHYSCGSTICMNQASRDLHKFQPNSISIRGRRFGYKNSSEPDFVANKGGKKARYISDNDCVCSVEEYVASALYGTEIDHFISHSQGVANNADSSVQDMNDPMYEEMLKKTDGLGWKSLHCEGSPLRSLFALLLWDDVLFCDVPDVFITPYQTKPLDLCHSSFSRSLVRLKALTVKLNELMGYGNDEIVQVTGASYRKHYKQICKGMNWNYSLDFLQLVAVCLGGANLSRIFRALFANFKFLSSGMPDLLSIRVRKVTVSASSAVGCECYKSEILDLSSLLCPGWEMAASEEKSWDDDLVNLTRKTPLPLTTQASSTTVSSVIRDESTTAEDVQMSYLKTAEKFDDERTDIVTISDLKLPVGKNVQYIYESMFIEVKGPHDSLAPNQLLWSFILSLSNKNVKNYVGYVKENKKRTNQKGL